MEITNFTNNASGPNSSVLINQGLRIFGSLDGLNTWLGKENFFFDKKRPAFFLNSDEGIKLIVDRLVGMEYGDNA